MPGSRPRSCKFHHRAATAIFLTTLAGGTPAASAADRPVLEYNRDVRPILAENCFACHGPDSAARKADLRLDRRDDAIKAGAIAPGDTEASELVARINAEDPKELMPPPVDHQEADAGSERTLLRRWIAEGAAYQPHWSLIPPKRPALPAVATKRGSAIRSTASSWPSSKRKVCGRHPKPTAGRWHAGCRFDLTGLPPEPADVEEFVNDPRPTPMKRWSPGCSTRPAGANIAPATGSTPPAMPTPTAITSTTSAKHGPFATGSSAHSTATCRFDQFTIEQLAGDLLPGSTLDQQIASGFNRCNSTTNEGGVIPEEYTVLYTRDRTETVSQVWMGLTAGCAVCHDHKFDPISQREFYELAAFFNNTTQPTMDGNIKDTPPTVFVPSEPDRARSQVVAAELAAARRGIEVRNQSARPDFAKWLAGPDPKALESHDSNRRPAAGRDQFAHSATTGTGQAFESADTGDFDKDRASPSGPGSRFPSRDRTAR